MGERGRRVALAIHPSSSSSSSVKACNRTTTSTIRSLPDMLLSQRRDNLTFPCAVKHDSDYLHGKLQIACAISPGGVS